MSMRPLLVLCLAGALSAVENAPTATPDKAVDPAPSAPADLLAALPQLPSLKARDGAVWWDNDQGAAFKVASVDNGNAQLETEAGKVTVPKQMLESGRLDALAALPRLVANATAAKQSVDGATLTEGVMTGLHLRTSDLLVIADGVLRKAPAEAVDRAAEVKSIDDADQKLKEALEGSALNVLGRKTVIDFVDRLAIDQKHGNRKFDYDEVTPAFARRVVRGGWLIGILGDTPTTKALRDAVAKAESFQAVTLFEGKNLRLAELRNAFGEGGWVLTTPLVTAYTHPEPAPMYYGADPGLSLVIELPAKSDPVTDSAKAVAARLYHGSQLIASWKRDEAFKTDNNAWRKVVPERGGHGVARGWMPPHILITDLDDDVTLLVTAHGELAPPQDGSSAEVERFVSQAATVLPDAPHLDLIGEHLFYYVYDSPDSRLPFLIGNKQVKGDIHQTVAQTLSTVTGGMCRGDCDDLAEFYEVISDRQGHTCHVISLPQHAAASWADQLADGWHVFILQTGPPLEFVDEQLPEALRKTYTSFDEGETFDPNGLGLLLRFSGENTRSSWRLSWRIFAEPEYAKTMIDVQKDWHFQTYQRGIKTMLDLIASGDDDTANYRELSGLYSYTGQYDLAVEYHQKALDLTADPESKLYAQLELVEHLFDAKQDAKARETAESILDDALPRLKDQLGERRKQLGLELAGFLAHGHAYDLGLRVLKETVLDEMTAQIDQLGQWLASPRFNKRQWEAAEQLRHLEEMYVGSALSLLDGLGPQALPGDETVQAVVRSVQEWLNNVAFHDIDDDDDLLNRYATAGRFYVAVLGRDRLLAMLEKVPLPTKADYAHAKRAGGMLQMTLDRAWIKLSVPFWFGLITEQFERYQDKLDKELVLRLGRQAAESYAACDKLDLESPFLEHSAHLAALITALVGQDEKTLRERLHFVAEKNDKRLRDDTAQWLGDTARFLPLDWYARVLQVWKDELNYKPKYYWIAWRAALNGAPAHALMVAKMASEQFGDDPAFIEEYQYMRQLLEKPRPMPDTPATVPAQPAPKE